MRHLRIPKIRTRNNSNVSQFSSSSTSSSSSFYPPSHSHASTSSSYVPSSSWRLYTTNAAVVPSTTTLLKYQYQYLSKKRRRSIIRSLLCCFVFTSLFMTLSKIYQSLTIHHNDDTSSSSSVYHVQQQLLPPPLLPPYSIPSDSITIPSNYKFVVVAPIYYTSINEIRFQLALEACQEAAKYGIKLLLVDGSPIPEDREEDNLSTLLTKAGNKKNEEDSSSTNDASSSNIKDWLSSSTLYTKVLRQQSNGKKGVALREAISAACQEMNASGADGNNNPHDHNNIVAFQELEKVNMFQHWKYIIHTMIEGGGRGGNGKGGATDMDIDIMIPGRFGKSFKETYPIEQYYAETFGNLYLNSLTATSSTATVNNKKNTTSATTTGLLPSNIDYTFGPMALRCSYASYWLNYVDGEIWDAQIIPMIHAAYGTNYVSTKNIGPASQSLHVPALRPPAKVYTITIDYKHSSKMKQQEEYDPTWSEKRLMQLNFLKDTVANELKKHNHHHHQQQRRR